MKKQIVLSVLLAMCVAPVMASVVDGSEITTVNKKESFGQTFNLIVKFKDSNVHNGFLADPATLEILNKKAKSQKVSLQSLQAKYNVETNVSYSYSISNLSALSAKNDVEFEHVRSMSMGADVKKVTARNDVALQDLIVKLVNSGDFEDVMVDTVMSKMSYNDTLYEEQRQFKAPSLYTYDGQNFENMRSKVVNNLGRKIRVGVVDSGYAPHEDISNVVEGYDFIYLTTGNYLEPHQRDSDPTDMSILADGTPCHDGHGLSVAGLIAAKSDNGLGVAGATNSDDVDLVYGRVLNCYGEGQSSDILDSVAWMSQEEVPGVPTIEKPVDVINLSLGGYRIAGCYTFEQKVYTKVREKGISVVVAAGNSNDNAKTFAPAACADVITVGAIGYDGDKASFSNYGENIDVMAAGSSLWMISSNEYKTQDLYFRGSGTSMAAPLITSAVTNMKLTYPDLTPSQIEALLVANGQGVKDGSLCSQLGCGGGSVDTEKLIDAIPTMLESVKYSKKHRYEGYNSEDQKVWLSSMDTYLNVCDLVKYTWGNIGAEMNGVEYKLYKNEADKVVYTETLTVPQKVLAHDKDTVISVQTCKDGVCGSVVQMRGEVMSPTACL